MSFPAYDMYKDSGEPWLGDIPAHWQLSAVRYAFENHDFRRVPLSGEHRSEIEKIYPYYGASGIIDYVDDYIFDEPLILVAEDGANLLSRSTPLAFVATGKYWVNNHAHILRPREGDLKFWEGLLQIYDYTPIVTGAAQPKLTAEQLAGIRLPNPPLDEQKAISSFLDAETSKIDSLVSEQRRLIELLKEKRQAVISHAVTKGLNPNAPMKPSGIAWVGEIPRHWGTPPVFARYYAVLGKMLDEAKLTGQHPIRYLRNADVNWDSINTEDLPVFDIEPDEYDRFTMMPGDILICEGGAGVGQTAIWQGELERCAFQKALHRLRPWNAERENPRYFYYCMRYVVETGVVLAAGTATIPHLTGEQLRKYRFPRPPRVEQDEIVESLNAKVSRFAALIAEAERAITLLQERRTALISAAVTGKIDVRGFADKEAVA